MTIEDSGMGTIGDGVRQAVENCLKVRSGEKAVVITDRETMEVGEALRAAVEKATGHVRVEWLAAEDSEQEPFDFGRIAAGALKRPKAEATGNMQFFVMEDFGKRPISFPQVMADALAAADVSIYAAQGAKGELQSFRRHMLHAIDANPKLRHAHMIGITPEIMRDGMCSDYAEIQRVSRLIYERVKDAHEIRVVTDKGCDFTAQFSGDLKWVISDGDIQPGHWKNLPDGEVWASPVTVNGLVVIDGCLGDFFAAKYGSLEDMPIRVQVKDGRARRDSLECDIERLRHEFGEYIFGTDQNSSRVGEFAIGSNTGLTHLIYNLLQDEKYPGIHIAFGSPMPSKTGATWDSKAHVDGVILRPSILVDGEAIMEKGTFHLD